MRADRILIAVLTIASLALPLGAQDFDRPDRGPRFLYRHPESGSLRPVDLNSTMLLRRRVTLRHEAATLGQLLGAIQKQAGLELIYSADIVPLNRVVGFRAENITVAAALTEILVDLPLDVVFYRPDQAALIARAPDGTPAMGAVRGRITDATGGQPVSSVQVAAEGETARAVSDAAGNYTLTRVPAGSQRVTARRIGYAPVTREVTVTDGATATLDFVMTRTATPLDQVVTTVTGGQRKVAIGNAIATIRADSVAVDAPVRDLGDFLDGRAPGVRVQYTGASVGQAPAIRIRGTNSFTVSNDPIVVIDGVRADNTPALGRYSGRLSDLVPSEIAGIEVVKGPSAATLYGTDAANGVLLVTTKRGQDGPARWSAYSEQGLSQIAMNIPLNYYAWGHTLSGAPVQCMLTALAVRQCVQDSITTANPLRDSPSSPLLTGYRHVFGANVSGGRQVLRYFVGAHLEDETGPLGLSKHEQDFLKQQRGVSSIPDEQVHPNRVAKMSLRSNGTVAVGTNAEVSVNASYVRNDLRAPDDYGPRYAIYGPGIPDTLRQWQAGNRPGYGYAPMSDDDVTRFLGGVTATWRPLAWLSGRATVGTDFANERRSYLVLPGQFPSSGLNTGYVSDNVGSPGTELEFAL